MQHIMSTLKIFCQDMSLCSPHLSLNSLLRCIMSGLLVYLEQLAVIHPHKSSKFKLLTFLKRFCLFKLNEKKCLFFF